MKHWRNKLKTLEDGKTSHVHRLADLIVKMAILPKVRYKAIKIPELEKHP
jgi:hypothetical protein